MVNAVSCCCTILSFIWFIKNGRLKLLNSSCSWRSILKLIVHWQVHDLNSNVIFTPCTAVFNLPLYSNIDVKPTCRFLMISQIYVSGTILQADFESVKLLLLSEDPQSTFSLSGTKYFVINRTSCKRYLLFVYSNCCVLANYM